MEGFLLGLSSGTTCLAHCAPVIVPHLLAEGNNLKNTACSLARFLSGRLLGYLLFGVIAWLLGTVIAALPLIQDVIPGIVFVVLAVSLAWSSLTTPTRQCTAQCRSATILGYPCRQKQPKVTILLGLLSGMNFCPPFLLSFSSSATVGSLHQSLFYFFTFFLGTSLYFLPITLLGKVRKTSNIRTVGKMMSGIMAVYFFGKGFLMLIRSVT